MSSSSLDEVRTTTGISLVRGSARMRFSTSIPLSFGSFRSSRTTAGMGSVLSPACLPVPNRKSSASVPSRATKTSFAILALRSARSVSSSSSGLSSTSMMIFSIIVSPAQPAVPSFEFRGGLLVRFQRSCRQELRHRLGIDGRGKQIPLALVAAVHAQEFQLLHGLDPLGDHAHRERMRERDHRLRDRRIVPSLVYPADERAVDLETVDRQPRQIAQARIAGAEVVHGDLHAQRLEALEDIGRLLAILDQHARGELELEQSRLELGRAQGAPDRFDEAGTAELLRRDVYGEPQRSESGVAPSPDPPAAFGEREFSE